MPTKKPRRSGAPARPRRKTARQKLETVHPSHGVPFEMPPQMQRTLGPGRMIVPRPLDVDAQMRRPRKGTVITLSTIRAALADAAGVEQCCPLTTGIFTRLAAEAAEEDLVAGKRRITPWWRLVRDNGAMIDKFPGGGDLQAERLRAEGVVLLRARGKGLPRVAALVASER